MGPDFSDSRVCTYPESAIAIIGMAFRFPGDLGDEESFWRALKDGRDMIGHIPPERWATKELQHPKRSEPGRSISFSAGVLSGIEMFDAEFFGISPREAAWLDPQQRLLLELAYESMENAGVTPSSLGGSNCAVYIGISGLDYGVHATDDLAGISPHMMTGNTLSIAANRLSYIFDLHGPSIAVDTACSSSLVALHHACNSIRCGEAPMALVGGVHLLMHPYSFVGFTKASMLSADGRCKPFDASANGYVRSEGGAVVLLKPLAKAIEDGDTIQSVILASGVNADGARKTGITIPSASGQSDLMRDVLGKSGLSPSDVDFIESHGTGTAVGDPVEAAAIGAVYGREREKPLCISSVKANVGHLEPASGMASLVKAVLSLKKHALPAALHLKQPNPAIDFAALNLELVTEYKELESPGGRPLTAGVNSFGFGGANAHVLLREFRHPCEDEAVSDSTDIPPLFLSSRNKDALNDLANAYAGLIAGKSEKEYYDIAWSAAFGRERMGKRLAVAAADAEEAAQMLSLFSRGEAAKKVFVEECLTDCKGVAFIYSGNGAQWVGMGRTLLAESSRFAQIIGQIGEAMSHLVGFSLTQELQADADHSRLDDTVVAQPLVFAIQVAITLLLRERGVEPDAVAGHSVGEVAAAWAAGALDLNQAILVICARSKAQGVARGSGRMAAVGLPRETVEELLYELGLASDVAIAGVNSPKDVTLSGNLAALMEVQKHVEPVGRFFRLLDIDYAFHSKTMDVIRPLLMEGLSELGLPAAGKALFISSVTGDVLDGNELDADYWWRNVRQPVRFADAVARLADLGYRAFVEIGPNAILQHYIRECLGAVKVKGRVLSTLRKGNDGLERIEETALRAQLLVDTPDLRFHFPYQGRRVCLPNYPWQREAHWYPRTSEGLLSSERRRVHPLLGWPLPDAPASWENVLDPSTTPWLADHKVGESIVLPGAAYMEMALAAARETFGGEHLCVEELDIISPILFDGEHARSLRFILDRRDGSFQIKSRQRLSNDAWNLHAAGRLLEGTASQPTPRIAPLGSKSRQITADEHYAKASALGLDYGPDFRRLEKASIADNRLEGGLLLSGLRDAGGYLLYPALFDVCFQSLVNFFPNAPEDISIPAFLPIKCGRLDVYGSEVPVAFRTILRRRGLRSLLADFELLDENGGLVARAAGCRFRAAHLVRHGAGQASSWEIVPLVRPHPNDRTPSGLWAVEELGEQVLGAFQKDGQERFKWFTQSLPLFEALVIAYAYEALQDMQTKRGRLPEASDGPYCRWLLSLLKQENLLKEEDGSLRLAGDPGLPPAGELWRSLLGSAPDSLCQLVRIGRVGESLAGLLACEVDGPSLLRDLQGSPIAESLYTDDPLYAGTRLAAEKVLLHMADTLPGSGRLRILEISPGLSSLPNALLETVPDHRFDYVLALPDDDLRTRQQSLLLENAPVSLATFDQRKWCFDDLGQGPDAFDLVLLRHSLHHALNPGGALEQARKLLAPGGILLVAERYPDWSADFIDGLGSNWWNVVENGAEGCVYSSLARPEIWKEALAKAGFSDILLCSEPAAESLAEGAYVMLARRPEGECADLPGVEESSWLLLADEHSRAQAARLKGALEGMGQHVFLAEDVGEANIPEDRHIVSLLGWGASPADASDVLKRMLDVVQTLSANQGEAQHLWIVTCGGALASNLPQGYESSPAQGALWGFGRVAMNELPLPCTLIDFANVSIAGESTSRLLQELLWPDGANEIILTEDARYLPVLQPQERPADSSPDEKTRFRLDFHAPGQLRNLLWRADKERPLAENEVEVSTRATGLNFRDVMYTMGLLPDEAVENGFAGASLGLEFSGVVSRIGASVKDLQPGDAVMGFGSSCFASDVITRDDALARMPEGWTFEAAATVPTVFFTAYYALKHLADMQPGEAVLIHGAAGGVGIAAIQLARHLGAEVFTTAGNDEKRDFVRLLGADRVFDSRSLDFADDVLAASSGQGVDVVLNCLAGEAMRRSLSTLKPFGRFLELGKRDFVENTSVGLRPLKNNISYYGIDADQLLTAKPELASRLFNEVMELFRQGILSPLPYRSFSVRLIADAFRVMQQARHIGKLVVAFGRDKPELATARQDSVKVEFSARDCWVVSGGLSGFGLESARWLASRGVGNLVLLGRRGLATPGISEVLEKFSEQGVQALALSCDISDPDAVGAAMERARAAMPPVTGILHAAAVFDDKLITGLDGAGIESVLQPKLSGAWNLHQASLDLSLKHFVLYSSVSTALGNPGQANYVAANAGLEALAAMRRQMGLPAVCIAWGPIGDTGYLVRNGDVREGLEQRLGRASLSSHEALAALDRLLLDAPPQRIVANFDWGPLSRLLASSGGTRFSRLNRDRSEQGAGEESFDVRELLNGKNPNETAEIIQGLIAGEIGQILCIDPERIAPDRALHDLGMDSLMAVELAMGLEKRFGVQFPIMALNDSPTLAKVSAMIQDKLCGSVPAGDEQPMDSMVKGFALQHGMNINPDEYAALAKEARALVNNDTRLID